MAQTAKAPLQGMGWRTERKKTFFPGNRFRNEWLKKKKNKIGGSRVGLDI